MQILIYVPTMVLFLVLGVALGIWLKGKLDDTETEATADQEYNSLERLIAGIDGIVQQYQNAPTDALQHLQTAKQALLEEQRRILNLPKHFKAMRAITQIPKLLAGGRRKKG